MFYTIHAVAVARAHQYDNDGSAASKNGAYVYEDGQTVYIDYGIIQADSPDEAAVQGYNQWSNNWYTDSAPQPETSDKRRFLGFLIGAALDQYTVNVTPEVVTATGPTAAPAPVQ